MMRPGPRWLAPCVIASALLAAAPACSLAQGGTAANGLVYSTASNSVVQRQPAAGSCHAVGRGLYSRPDRRCTPGALNSAVTQATIGQTICRSGWTEVVRPAESVTESEKYMSMAAYGDVGSASVYEYDHLVPLELGGATNDARNLWPEPGGSPNRKDILEDYLKRQVCERRMTLAQAQKLIATNWVAAYRRLGKAGPTTPTGSARGAARCSASARWNSGYGDYDVYVTSNQPDVTATVTGAGTSAGFRTNSAGYADVYFHASRTAAGDRISVSVGSAKCSAIL